MATAIEPDLRPTVIEPDLRPPAGYSNYSPAEHVLLAKMKEVIGRVYEANGFNRFEPPPAAARDNLVLKGGLSKQIYGIERVNKEKGDDGQTRVGLPFDRTVPFALFLATHPREVTYPYKRQDISISWRGEHAAPGRFRGFYQCDVDIAGRDLSLVNDVQPVMTMMEALDNIGIRNYTMLVNHITFARALLKEAGMKKDKIQKGLSIIDGLDKTPCEKIKEELMRYDASLNVAKVDQVINLFLLRGKIDAFKLEGEWSKGTQDALKIVQELFQAFKDAGADMDRLGFCPGMVRGLDYYTGIVFETFIRGHEEFGSIASGGRYDDLVGAFNPKMKDIQGVGGSIGLTRLFDVLVRNKLIKPTRTVSADAVVLYRDGSLRGEALKLANLIKKEGIPVDIYTGNESGLGGQLKYAGRCGYPFSALVLGQGRVQVKDMKAEDPTQKNADFETLADAARSVKERYNPDRHGLINFTV